MTIKKGAHFLNPATSNFDIVHRTRCIKVVNELVTDYNTAEVDPVHIAEGIDVTIPTTTVATTPWSSGNVVRTTTLIWMIILLTKKPTARGGDEGVEIDEGSGK
jgi:hypothetical protein